MNFEGSAKKLYTLPWQALYDLAVEKQIDAEEIKHKEKTEIIRRVLATAKNILSLMRKEKRIASGKCTKAACG